MFSCLTQRRRTNLYYFLKEKSYIKNQYIFKEGDKVNGIYLTVNGEMKRTKTDNKHE